MKHTHLILLFIAFVTPLLWAQEQEGSHHYAECKSHNVWDAGFVLNFDLTSYTGGSEPRIQARIYELVPLWRKQLDYEGSLEQTGPGYTEVQLCEFDLSDRAVEPRARVSFKVGGAEATILLESLNGARPEKFNELECDPKLTDLLLHYCSQP